jgi:hypothetical protein
MSDKTESSEVVVDFSKHSTPPTEAPLTNEEYLEKGMEAFIEASKESEGFLAVTFDDEGSPQIIWAGNLDPFKTLGAMQFAIDTFKDKIH